MDGLTLAPEGSGLLSKLQPIHELLCLWCCFRQGCGMSNNRWEVIQQTSSIWARDTHDLVSLPGSSLSLAVHQAHSNSVYLFKKYVNSWTHFSSSRFQFTCKASATACVPSAEILFPQRLRNVRKQEMSDSSTNLFMLCKRCTWSSLIPSQLFVTQDS